jgi:alanine-glyoxylate transaminase/serine-glyoxylate transaminase/serine-pyruvate transaminase
MLHEPETQLRNVHRALSLLCDNLLLSVVYDRLITVNTIKVPEGVDWAAVVKNAMDKYSLEIAGGLGPTAGKVWRIGIMGYNARPQNVALVVEAFRDGLQQQGKL